MATLQHDYAYHNHTHKHYLITKHKYYYLIVTNEYKNLRNNAILLGIYYQQVALLHSLRWIIPTARTHTHAHCICKLNHLHSALEDIKIYVSQYIDNVVTRLLSLIALLFEFRNFVSPSPLMSATENPVMLHPTTAAQCPDVFERYIPGVRAPMREHELPGYINETQELQLGLRQSWITTSTQGRKRHVDEEMLT
ncbi:unnamed protein product, partial [Meganyctiphanes norvegica]